MYKNNNSNPSKSNKEPFFMFPQCLLKAEEWEGLSLGAKVLYMILLNMRMLSCKNSRRYSDKSGRVYVIFGQKRIEDMLKVTDKTARKYLDELVQNGLIRKVDRGPRKSPYLYVKNLIDPNDQDLPSLDEVKQLEESVGVNGGYYPANVSEVMRAGEEYADYYDSLPDPEYDPQEEEEYFDDCDLGVSADDFPPSYDNDPIGSDELLVVG